MSEPIKVWLLPDMGGRAAIQADARPFDDPRWEEYAAIKRTTYDALSARVAKLEAALRFYGDAENYKRQPVVDSFTGGTVPPNCPDKDAHVLAKFSEINGAPPHFCGSTEDDETERHEVYGPGMADYPAVVLEGGAKARAALEEPK